MLFKALKFIGITIVCLIVSALISALSYRKYLQHTVAEHRAIHLPNGISTLDPVRIGGIEQWIEVRGQNVNNPILLFIHGGPGIAFIPLSGEFQGPWEKYFTVVQWDQRGAGKTYSSNGRELQRRGMNIPQMEQDSLDVVNYLCTRFKRDKLFVVGHSWGSILGLWLAHEHPERIYAYVGVGQFINGAHNEEVAYQDALQQARRSHNEQALKDLASISPYPASSADFRKSSIARHWESVLLGPPSGAVEFTNVGRILSDVASAPEYSLADDLGFVRGQMFSLNVFFSQLPTVTLDQLGRDFREPIFFFEGSQDPYCRPSVILEYSRTITAPGKGYVAFQNSGHFPFFDKQQEFTDELVQRVLPFANDHPPTD